MCEYVSPVSVRWTHIKDGDDRGVIPADYSGNILRLGHLRRNQLKGEEETEEGREISVEWEVR